MVCHIDRDEYTPTVLPCEASPFIKAIKKSQLLLAEQPDHEHPELGLVSTSIHTVEQRFVEIPLMRVLTCEVGSLPLQGNMQISVESPAALAFWMLLAAFVSKIPEDLKALMMAKEYPLFLKHVKVATEEAANRSIPLAEQTPKMKQLIRSKLGRILIINKQKIVSFPFFRQWFEVISASIECDVKDDCLLSLPINKSPMEAEQRQRYNFSGYSSAKTSQAFDAVSQIVSSIFDGSWNKICSDLRFQEHLTRFSKLNALLSINQISNLHSRRIQESPLLTPAGQEPQPLIQDSLLPISVEIHKAPHSNNKSALQPLPSEKSKAPRKKQLRQETIVECHKLDIVTQQDDKFVNELRKMQEEKIYKLIATQKSRKAQDQILKAKLRSKVFQKMTFDFSGSQLRVKSQTMNNLISKLINPEINSSARKIKEAFDDLNPTTIDDTLSLTKRKSLLNQTRRKDQVQFNQDRSLIESIELSSGSRYTQEGKILYSKKNPQGSIYELKLAMGQGKKLSKSEFQKLKVRNATIFSPQRISVQDKIPSGQLVKSSSLPVLPKIKEVKLAQRILVNSEEQRVKLLEDSQDREQKKLCQVIRLKEMKVPLGKMDIFNIKYLRSRNQQIDERDSNIQERKAVVSFPLIKSSTQVQAREGVAREFTRPNRRDYRDAI